MKLLCFSAVALLVSSVHCSFELLIFMPKNFLWNQRTFFRIINNEQKTEGRTSERLSSERLTSGRRTTKKLTTERLITEWLTVIKFVVIKIVVISNIN